MTIQMYEYPKCGTCRRAKKYLEEKQITFETEDITKNPPTKQELARLIQQSGQPVRKFFNTSGKRYRELGLSKKMNQLSDEEKLELLSSDGMLIKRPIVTDGERATVGFREEEFDQYWGE